MKKWLALAGLLALASCSDTGSATKPCTVIDQANGLCTIPTPTPSCVVPVLTCDAFTSMVYKCHATPEGMTEYHVGAKVVNSDGVIEAKPGDIVTACRSCGCSSPIELR